MAQLLRFLFGGGWWTLWYGVFYLVTLFGNLVWFNEIAEWTKKGKSGPEGGAVFMGMVSMGGLPVLFFTVVHLVLASRRSSDTRLFLILFSLAILALVLVWMIACTASMAGASRAGFVGYYVIFAFLFLLNLGLLWVARQRLSVQSLLPF